MAGLSSSERQTLEKAIESLTQAVEFEEQEYPPHQVLRHYCRGLRLLLPLLASPRCSGQYRHILQQKCCHYWSKTRHLQSLLLSKSRNDHTKTHNDVTVNPENDNTAETRNYDATVANPESSLRTDDGGAATRPDNDGEAQNLTKPDSLVTVEQTASGTKKKKCAVKYRQVYCEVATVEVASYDSDEEGSDEAQAEQRALREAQEVERLARQFFSREDTEGLGKQQHDAEEDIEAARRHLLVQRVLDAIIQTSMGRGVDLSWVKGPGVGLEDLEIALRERLVLPLTFPKIITGRYCPYLLLYGQPGDGILPLLSYLNKAWATYQSLVVSGRSLLEAVFSGTVTEKDLVEGLFSQAFRSAPCSLCVTDFEVFGCSRQFEGLELEHTARRLKTEMLVKLETLRRRQEVVIFVAVTSRPWLLDPVVRRKFSYRGYCPCPIPEERAAVLMEAVKRIPHSFRQVDLRRIAERTPLFSRADMRILADEAHAMLKLRVQEAKYFRPLCSVSHSPSSRDTTHDSSNPTHLSQHEGERTTQQGNSTGGTECCSRGTIKGPGQKASEESDHEVEQFPGETDTDETHEDGTDQCRWDGENFSPGTEKLGQEPGGSDQGAQASSEDSEEEETDLKRRPREGCGPSRKTVRAAEPEDTDQVTRRASSEDSEEEETDLKRRPEKTMRTATLSQHLGGVGPCNDPKRTAAAVEDDCDTCSSRNDVGAENDMTDEGAGTISRGHRQCSSAELSCMSDNDPKMTAGLVEDDRDTCDSRNIASAERERDEEGACNISHQRQRSSQAELSAGCAADASAEPNYSASCPEVPVMYYIPCRPGDEGAIPMTWLDVDPRRLLEPELTYDDVVAAIRHIEGEVDEDDVRRLRQWHEDFGST